MNPSPDPGSLDSPDRGCPDSPDPGSQDSPEAGSSGSREGEPSGSRLERLFRGVPLRTILSVDVIVVATGLVCFLIWQLRTLLLLVVVAGFIALVLNPLVEMLTRRGMGRGSATTAVCLACLVVLVGLVGLLAVPVYHEGVRFAKDLPHLVNEAKAGKGRIGHLVERFHIAKIVNQNAPKLSTALTKLTKPALDIGKRILGVMVDTSLILILTVFFLLEAPMLRRGTLSLFSASDGNRVRSVSGKVATKVSGYVLGNVLTSILIGLVMLFAMLVLGVPFATVLAVWVALVDLLPLVGGLLAGVPVVGVALLHSLGSGIIMAVLFIVYQEVENHVLSPIVMSRTVRLNPLWVFLAVLFGANLGGLIASDLGAFVGALIAIPFAGAVQVFVQELRQSYQMDRGHTQEGSLRLAHSGAAGEPPGGPPGSVTGAPLFRASQGEDEGQEGQKS